MQCMGNGSGKRRNLEAETQTYASTVLGCIAVKTIEREDFACVKKVKLAPLKMPTNLPPLDLPPLDLPPLVLSKDNSKDKRPDMVCLLAPTWALEFRASC